MSIDAAREYAAPDQAHFRTDDGGPHKSAELDDVLDLQDVPASG